MTEQGSVQVVSSAVACAAWRGDRARKLLALAMSYDAESDDPNMDQFAHYVEAVGVELQKCDEALRSAAEGSAVPAARDSKTLMRGHFDAYNDAEAKLLSARCCVRLLEAHDWEKVGALSADGAFLLGELLDSLDASLQNLQRLASGLKAAA